MRENNDLAIFSIGKLSINKSSKRKPGYKSIYGFGSTGLNLKQDPLGKMSSNIGFKKVDDKEMMNTSAPIKISQYISSSLVSLDKAKSKINSNFSSVTPKYNQVCFYSLLI